MTRMVSLPMASPVGRYTRHDPRSPMARPSGRRRSGICAAQSPGDTAARAEARCRRGVSQVGKSPSGHLFESLTSGYIVSEIDPRDLNPTQRAQPELKPHALVVLTGQVG